ncbi:helix-turn-helix domain-containing protein [bacterium]|nr:helix-turn-helix domain-containing protein [bacterium]
MPAAEPTQKETIKAARDLGLGRDHRDYDPLFGLREAANYLGVSTDKLSLMARTRQIAVVRSSQKQGSPLKFRLSALNAWVKAHEIKPLRFSNG